MVRLIKKKVEGATIIEALIAMVIIMIVFAMAITLFGNVMNTGVSFKKIQIQNQLDVLCKQVQKDGYIKEKLLHIDSINYNLSTDTSAIPGISKLIISAKRNTETVGTMKCLYKVMKIDED